MRLKTFTARSMGEAIALVRDTLGPDAIIVSDQQDEDGGGVRVTAAIDTPIDALGAIPSAPDALDKLTDALAHHGVPAGLAERILAGAARAQLSTADAAASLAEGIGQCFYFDPLGAPGAGGKPIMLVGLPAAGKTVAAAKLAAHAARADRPVTLIAAEIATEPARSGPPERLAGLARALGVDLVLASGWAELRRAARAAADDLVLIDCGGSNPYDDAGMAALKQAIEAADAEPILAVAAGGDAAESADIAAAFAAVGVRRMIATRADLARRLGGVLAAAEAGGLALAGIVASGAVSDRVEALDALVLAHRLLPRPGKTAAAETDIPIPLKQAVAS